MNNNKSLMHISYKISNDFFGLVLRSVVSDTVQQHSLSYRCSTILLLPCALQCL